MLTFILNSSFLQSLGPAYQKKISDCKLSWQNKKSKE